MGYDITFHPVGLAELRHFLFDVIEEPSLLESRVAELIPDPEGREAMEDALRRTLRAIETAEREIGITPVPRDTSRDPTGDEEEDLLWPQDTVRFLAAGIAGFRHPYWYSRGAGLFSVPGEDASGQTYQDLIGGRLAKLEDDIVGITQNYAASGFFPPDAVVALRDRISSNRSDYLNAMGERGFEALTLALEYASSRGLGLIEASDVVFPGGNVFLTDPANLRAHYLKNLKSSAGDKPLPPFRGASQSPPSPPDASPADESTAVNVEAVVFLLFALLLGFAALASKRYFLMFPAILAAGRGFQRLSDH